MIATTTALASVMAPSSAFRIPHSAFRIPHSHSALRIPHSALFLHVLLRRLRSDLRAVDVAGGVNGDALGGARAAESLGPGLGLGIGNEALDLPVLDAAPADPSFPAVVIARHRLGFRVRDVERVALDEDAARPAELPIFGDELAVLIEHLHAVVVAIADEQPSLRVEGERVRLVEFTRSGAELAPLLDELAGLVELQDPVVAGAVSFANEDVAVRCGDDVVRLIKIVGRRRAARLAEREQHFAVGAELEDLVALGRAGPRTDRAARRGAAPASGFSAGRFRTAAACARAALRQRRIVLAVGDPHVAVAIDMDAVREDQHAGGEAFHQLAAGVEFHHRRDVHDLAGRAIETAVQAAALRYPDRLAVLVDVDGARRSPRAAFGELEVVLDGGVWVGRVVGGLNVLRARGRNEQRPSRRIACISHKDSLLAWLKTSPP